MFAPYEKRHAPLVDPEELVGEPEPLIPDTCIEALGGCECADIDGATGGITADGDGNLLTQGLIDEAANYRRAVEAAIKRE
jgi:hypothetical protein